MCLIVTLSTAQAHSLEGTFERTRKYEAATLHTRCCLSEFQCLAPSLHEETRLWNWQIKKSS